MSSSDTDSSDAEALILDVGRYEQLQLGSALSHILHQRRAMQELTACLSRDVYGWASKQCQTAMYADVLLAVELCDRRPSNIETLQDMVKAAEKVLPQQKRSKVQADLKRKLQTLARTDRKNKAENATDDEEEKPPSDVPLPPSVAHYIFSRLDPVSLARASCVCRSWQQTASAPDLWSFWENSMLFPRSAARLKTQHPLSTATFGRLVAAHPLSVLPFKTGRMLRSGTPAWLHSDATCNAHHGCTFQRQRQNAREHQRQILLQQHPPNEHEPRHGTQQQDPQAGAIAGGLPEHEQHQVAAHSSTAWQGAHAGHHHPHTHLQQGQHLPQRERLKIKQHSLPVQRYNDEWCYPPSLYSRTAPCSVDQVISWLTHGRQGQRVLQKASDSDSSSSSGSDSEDDQQADSLKMWDLRL